MVRCSLIWKGSEDAMKRNNLKVLSPLMAMLLWACEQDECSDDFDRGESASCRCTSEQKEDDGHACCYESGGDCQENGGTPDPQCGLEVVGNGLPVFQVQELSFFSQVDGSVFIDACEDFLVHFVYYNPMNRDLEPPGFYGFDPPEVTVTEVLGTTPPSSAPAAWSTIEACGNEPHNEEFGGIQPNNQAQSGRFTVQITPLPETVSGTTATGMDIGFFATQC